MSKPLFGRYRAVVFDVYGTLLRIPEQRSAPYRALLRWLAAHGRRPNAMDAVWVMTQNLPFDDFARSLGVPAPLIETWAAALDNDLAAVTVFEDVETTLDGLSRRKLPVAICSNAAHPYRAPLHRLIRTGIQHEIWSFAVGTIKPAPAIYAACSEVLQCPPSDILFVGDTPAADVDGPRSAGFGVRLIDRQQPGVPGERLQHLTQLFQDDY
ncbi:HAD family hydrolase [Simiduia agarivorans]|nr:HAD-IA family hydrolase [Simiduia agarivorans]